MPVIIYCCWVGRVWGFFGFVGFIFFFIPLCAKSSHSVQVNQMFKLISSCCPVLPSLKCSGKLFQDFGLVIMG